MASPAKVTLAGTPAFVLGGQWPQFVSDVNEHFPLRNLHWKSSTRTSIRTIQQLDIELSPLDFVHVEPQPHSLILENPLLNIYVVSCDDADTYKSTVKRQVQDWRSVMTPQTHQEWLVVLVSPPEALAGSKKRFQMKGSILDKLRSDFNIDKRDRCAQLTWSSNIKDPTLWADFVSKMKEGVLASLDFHVSTREEDVRRLEAQRQSQDWSFYSFCRLKDVLASSFVSLGLLEDAQLQMDELEATYFQLIKEKGRNPIASFGATSSRDDSAPLLSSDRQPYRDGRITVFDFRTYVFCRQWDLMVKRHEYLLAVEKAVRFIPAFSRSLRQMSIGPLFVPSWIYSSCLNTIDHIQDWKAPPTDPASTTKIHWFKATLYDLARSQLDQIGAAFGHLPPTHGPQRDAPIRRTESHGISQKDLLAAIADKVTFDKLYIMITNRAIECYTLGSGKRSALKLHASLALLDSHRHRFGEALSTFRSLPAHYTSNQWTLLRGYMLVNSLNIDSLATSEKNATWVQSALDFLRCSVSLGHDDTGQRLLLKTPAQQDASDASNSLVAQIVRELSQLTLGGVEAHTILEHPVFHVDWPSITLSGYDPGTRNSVLDARIHNSLKQPIVARSITISMVQDWGGDEVHYTAGAVQLVPGDNRISLSTLIPQPGSYTVTHADISFPLFTIRYRSDNSRADKRASLQTIKPQGDDRPVNVDVRLPSKIEIGTPPVLEVIIDPGTQRMQQINLQLKDSSDRIQFLYEQASSSSAADISYRSVEDWLEIRNMSLDTPTVIQLPFSGSLLGSPVKILINGQYLIDSESCPPRRFRKEQLVSGALPVIVNVQDVFRQDRLFWRFTISSDGKHFVRVLSTALASDTLLSDSGVFHHVPTTEIVSPSSSMSALMRIDEAEAKAQAMGGSLRFWLQYRTLRQEVASRVRECMRERAAGSSNPDLVALGHDANRMATLIEHTFLRLLDQSAGWEDIYSNTSRALLRYRFSQTDPAKQQHEMLKTLTGVNDDIGGSNLPQEEIDKAVELLDSVSQALAEPIAEAQMGVLPNQELVLPLDLPRINIINKVTLKLRNDAVIQSGQPIQCVVRITSTFETPWPGLDTEGCAMRYGVGEVNSMELNSWLISGASRGEFQAQHNSSHEILLTLIALRHGELTLPSVSVEPKSYQVDASGRSALFSETYQQGAAERVRVLPRGAGTTYTIAMPLREFEPRSSLDT